MARGGGIVGGIRLAGTASRRLREGCGSVFGAQAVQQTRAGKVEAVGPKIFLVSRSAGACWARGWGSGLRLRSARAPPSHPTRQIAEAKPPQRRRARDFASLVCAREGPSQTCSQYLLTPLADTTHLRRLRLGDLSRWVRRVCPWPSAGEGTGRLSAPNALRHFSLTKKVRGAPPTTRAEAVGCAQKMGGGGGG